MKPYEVVCDETNNSPFDRDRGILNVDVYLDPDVKVEFRDDFNHVVPLPANAGLEETCRHLTEITSHEQRYLRAIDIAMAEVQQEFVGAMSTPETCNKISATVAGIITREMEYSSW